MTAEVVRIHTIQRVMNEFLGLRAASLDPEELVTHRRRIHKGPLFLETHAEPLRELMEDS